uniref:Uncharacterized protein n=1 Tax=Periophthalmus magnuspinnatus TaxID=409849 RepID=A0A3B4B2W8_9GOBI
IQKLIFSPMAEVTLFNLSTASALSDDTFLMAAAIFQHLREDKPITQQLLVYGKKTDTALPSNTDKTTEMQAYQLAFSTLKCMLVTLFYYERKFSLHSSITKDDEEEHHQDVRDLRNSLERFVCKTKLAASLARFRVKQSLRSVSSFLLDPVRTKQHQAKSLPLYVWINTLMYSTEEVCEVLQSAGLREVKSMTELKELSFCRDHLCSDTLVFSKELHHRLIYLVDFFLQERSLCVAVNVLRPLLFDGGDVLMAGSFSAVTVAHLGILFLLNILKRLKTTFSLDVRILSESFFELNEWEKTVQHLKVILVLPQCSSSALNDPVPIMHSENGETVQDVLARAAAKGLLGGILPEQSKRSKKAKGKKSQQAGSHSEQEADDEDDQGEEDEEENDKSGKVGKKKKKGGKGHKANSKSTKSQSKGGKKKVKKKKVNQGKKKPRRIPRLTLSLMSSAKASARLSLITPLVKKLKDNAGLITTSSETSSGSSTPARKLPPSAGPAPRTEAVQKQLGKTGVDEEEEGEVKVMPRVERQGGLRKDQVRAKKVVGSVDSEPPHEFSSSSVSIKSDTSLSAQES